VGVPLLQLNIIIYLIYFVERTLHHIVIVSKLL